VNPVVLRAPLPDVALWAFPARDELLHPLASKTTTAKP
jgi:hypothetical protein